MFKKILLLCILQAMMLANDPITITPPIAVECVKYMKFTTCYSNDLNRSVYTIENLTLNNIKKSETMVRKNSFHEDPYLKTNILNNFIGSIYDKGHMAPSGNMPSIKSQYESFSMANMIPQHYSNNRGNWKRLENTERTLTLSLGKLTVISGTYGSNGNIKTSDIPKYVFKIFKNGDYLKVYIINNDGTQDVNETNITSLTEASGYKFKY